MTGTRRFSPAPRAAAALAAVLLGVGPAGATLPLPTFENYWLESWLESFAEADNAFRFSSGSISGTTMYLAEDLRVTKELAPEWTLRLNHHFESGLIERVKSEETAWRNSFGVFEIERALSGPWVASLLLLPTYDKREASLGFAVALARERRRFVRLSVLHALLARSTQAYYDRPEASRHYDVPATYVHLQGVWALGPSFELWGEAQWFRQRYTYWGSAGPPGTVDETNLLWRAKLRAQLAPDRVARLRVEGEDGRTYEELSFDGLLSHVRVRTSAGYGYYRERQSDFFTDTFLEANAFADLYYEPSPGNRFGFGYGVELPRTGWLPRFRSVLPIQRKFDWWGPPDRVQHLRLLWDWDFSSDLKLNFWFTFDNRDLDFATILFWGRLLRVQAEFRF